MHDRFVQPLIPILVALCALSGCHLPRSELCAPLVQVPLCKRDIRSSPTAFPQLSDNELRTDWGKELKVARAFGRDFDLYRAVTFYKRALILMPPSEIERRREAEYGVILAYYLGDKYSSVIEAFEQSSLGQVQGSDFPAFEDLLLILEDCYERICEEGRAKQVLELLRSGDPDLAADLETSHALSSHSIELAAALARPLWQEDIADFRSSYCQCRLNPCTAQVLQGLLPGAGYWYVGQRQSGVTSFLVNLAFTAAAWHFFEQENWGAALFMTSMEFGWYVGGIYGAGLAAERWNENWYDCNMRPFLRDRSFTPALMLQFSF